MSESLDEYYKTLRLEKGSSKDEIKRAYRKLALQYHPDKNPGNEEWAAKIFTAINRAYSVLIDKDHVGESFDNIEEAKEYFRKNFFDLARRINSSDYISDKIFQEECDFFFKYQLEQVATVRRSIIEARRIINLLRKAMSKGYDTSEILKEHGDFFQKYGFSGEPECNDYDELIKEYKKIIENEPSNSNAHYNLGFIYEKRDMFDDALLSYQIAVNIDPTNEDAKCAIERLRKRRMSDQSVL